MLFRMALGAHPAYYIMDTGALSQGIKRPGGRRETDQSPPNNAEVKKICIYTSIPQYVLKA
jgi:hypothetical protein